jgi:hypothetical protein
MAERSGLVADVELREVSFLSPFESGSRIFGTPLAWKD